MSQNPIVKKVQVGAVMLSSLFGTGSSQAKETTPADNEKSAARTPANLDDEKFAISLAAERFARAEKGEALLTTIRRQAEQLLKQDLQRSQLEEQQALADHQARRERQVSHLWEETHAPWQFDVGNVARRWEAQDAHDLEAHRKEMQARANSEEHQRLARMRQLGEIVPHRSPEPHTENNPSTKVQQTPATKKETPPSAKRSAPPEVEKTEKKVPAADKPLAGAPARQALVLQSEVDGFEYVGSDEGKLIYKRVRPNTHGKEEYIVIGEPKGGNVRIEKYSRDLPVSLDGHFQGPQVDVGELKPGKGKSSKGAVRRSFQPAEISGELRALGWEGCWGLVTPEGRFVEGCVEGSVFDISAGASLGLTGPHIQAGVNGPSVNGTGKASAAPICIGGTMIQAGVSAEGSLGPGIEGSAGVKRTGSKVGLGGVFAGGTIEVLSQDDLTEEQRKDLDCPPQEKGQQKK